MSHTPGPWGPKCSHCEHFASQHAWLGQHGNPPATPFSDWIICACTLRPDRVAQADLLEALDRMITIVEAGHQPRCGYFDGRGCPCGLDDARAALLKARG
jgi:hypothetical protein